MTFRIEKWISKNGISECVANYGGGYTESDIKALIRGYKKTDKIGDIQFYQRKGSNTVWVAIEE